MNKRRLYKILKKNIGKMEAELREEYPGFRDENDIRTIILNEFEISEEDYKQIMFGKTEKNRSE